MMMPTLKFRTPQDEETYCKNYFKAVEFLLTNTDIVLTSKGWTINKKYASENSQGFWCIICGISKIIQESEVTMDLCLHQWIDQCLLTDSGAKIKEAIPFPSDLELSLHCQRVLMFMIKTIETAADYASKRASKVPAKQFFEQRLTSTGISTNQTNGRLEVFIDKEF
jgi:hypothetical protein